MCAFSLGEYKTPGETGESDLVAHLRFQTRTQVLDSRLEGT